MDQSFGRLADFGIVWIKNSDSEFRFYMRKSGFFLRWTLNPFPMGRRPFGSPFNFSYFPLVSASIPFANLFMVWFCIQWLFCGNFNQKSASGKFSLLQPNALSHILLQESKRSFSPVFWKNPLQVLVNHPTNNHLRIRWSVIRSLHWCWMTSSRLTDLSPAENQNFEKWKNHKEKKWF